MDAFAKEVPPVPLKTYEWEEVRRAKKRGKYPYTHLYKGPYKEMEKGKTSPTRKVRKLKKMDNVDELTLKDKTQPAVYTITTETEEEVIAAEDKDVETIAPNNTRVIWTSEQILDVVVIAHDDEKLKGVEEILMASIDMISKDKADQISVDAELSKTDSKNTESEDTYTESNIEQYLDKGEVSKNASITDLEQLPTDTTLESQTLQLPSEKKRKHSDDQTSELTKSNLSLFEKMKKAKFKMPTFKIPTFKSKTPKSKTKSDPKIKTTTTATTTTATTSTTKTATSSTAKTTSPKKKPDSPVYIYIPLNPTPEQLELEEQSKKEMQTSPKRTNGHSPTLKSQKRKSPERTDTKGAIPRTTTTSKLAEDIKKFAMKFKSTTKQPKKSTTQFKKPKPVKKTEVSTRMHKNSDDYVPMPLKEPLSQTEVPSTEENENSKSEGINLQALDSKLEPTVTKSETFVAKLKRYKFKQTPKATSTAKKKGIKPLTTKNDKTTKKSSPKETKRDDAPVDYIYIPLKSLDNHEDKPGDEKCTPLVKDSVISKWKGLKNKTKQTPVAKKTSVDNSSEQVDNIQKSDSTPMETAVTESETMNQNELEQPICSDECNALSKKKNSLQLEKLDKSEETSLKVESTEDQIKTEKDNNKESSQINSAEKVIDGTETTDDNNKFFITANDTEKVLTALSETMQTIDVKDESTIVEETIKKSDELKNKKIKKKGKKIKSETKHDSDDGKNLSDGKTCEQVATQFTNEKIKADQNKKDEVSEIEDNKLENIAKEEETTFEHESVEQEEIKLSAVKQLAKIPESLEQTPTFVTEITDDTKTNIPEMLEVTNETAIIPLTESSSIDTKPSLENLPKQEQETQLITELTDDNSKILEAPNKAAIKLENNVPITEPPSFDTTPSLENFPKEEQVTKLVTELTDDTKANASERLELPNKVATKSENILPTTEHTSSDAKSSWENLSKQEQIPKKSVVSKWKDLKHKTKTTTSVEKKKASPKITKKEKKKHSITSQQSDDKPVEYIYIPLNPTKEELAAELEQKLKEEEKQKKHIKTVETKTKTKNANEKKQGAIKKTTTTTKPEEKKISSFKKLTEDIKKFALKIKNLKKKPTKPTFKTSKRASKISISKKLSPTSTGKLSTLDNRTKPVNSQKSDDSRPIEYIFIPLKDSNLSTSKEETIENILVESSEKNQTPMTQTVLESCTVFLTVQQYKQLSKEDEEDGLKTPIREEQLLKSSPKPEDSPKSNKKVSFHTPEITEDASTSKVVDYEAIHDKEEPQNEEIQYLNSTPLEEKRDEEEEKVIQSTPLKEEEHTSTKQEITVLEEDNKWSKLSDHEYEPINPPPETVTMASIPPEASTSTHTIKSPAKAKTNEPMSLASAAAAVAAETERRMLRIPLDSELIITTVEETQQVKTSAPSIPGETRIETQRIKKTKITSKKEKKTEPTEQGPNIQQKLRTQAGRLKTKIKGIKKPTFTIPNPKFQRPKFTLPKMPERPKINFPSFSLPRPSNLRRHRSEEKQVSTTDSNAETKKKIFDFKTYPRLFERKTKQKQEVEPEFATVPRAAARKQGPVGARWAHRFSDIQYADDGDVPTTNGFSEESDNKELGDAMEQRMEADLRYEESLEDDDFREYEQETRNINQQLQYNVDYPDRWQHGTLHENFQQSSQNALEDEHSSLASSGSRHQHGVLEEIDSDQFFLREKGISQDNIEMGLYLSSEIRDAFRYQVNALTQMENTNIEGSNLSLPRPNRPKRKQLKKTKKAKKTPHASDENVCCDQESLNTEPEDVLNYKTFPPSRPKRSKKSYIVSSEQIDDDINLDPSNFKSQEDLQTQNETLPNIIGYIPKDLDVTDEYNKYLNDDNTAYENEMMKGIQQPQIVVSADRKYEIQTTDIDSFFEDTRMEKAPKPPARRQKSLKSLNLSEQDSIMGEFNHDLIMQDMFDQELNVYRVEQRYISPDEESPTLNVTRSEDDHNTPTSECEEQPCVKDIRDAMGYAIIDKTKQRDPPLPSQRKRRSNKSSKSDLSETKFHTVPRQVSDESPPQRPLRNYSTLGPHKPPRRKSEPELAMEDEKENIDITQYFEIEEEDHRDLQSGEVINKMKSRPLPAPPRPPRKQKEVLRDITHESNLSLTDTETKLTEKIEESEVSTQTDPLPDDFCCDEMIEEPTDRIVAPTRRKRSDSLLEDSRHSKTPDRSVSPNAIIIEHRVHTPTENETITHASLLVKPVAEYPSNSYVSTRFGCDFPELVNTNLLPLKSESQQQITGNQQQPYIHNYEINPSEILDLDSKEIHENNVSIIDNKINSKDKPDSPERPRRKSQTLTSQSFKSGLSSSADLVLSEELSDAPEKPQRRKSQTPQIIEQIIERQIPVCVTPDARTEVETLRAQRLQVTDLDVERLNVSELQAHKILVSEIDGVSLQISELNSKSGNLIVNGLEIPSGLLQEILDRMQQTPAHTEQVATQTSIEEKDTNDMFTELSHNEEPMKERSKEFEEIQNMEDRLRVIENEISENVNNLTPESITNLREEIDDIINTANEHINQNVGEELFVLEESPILIAELDDGSEIIMDVNTFVPHLESDLYRRLHLEQEEQNLIERLQSETKLQEQINKTEDLDSNEMKVDQILEQSSVVPKEFNELKSEQEKILEVIKRKSITKEQEVLDHEEAESSILRLVEDSDREQAKDHNMANKETTHPNTHPSLDFEELRSRIIQLAHGSSEREQEKDEPPARPPYPEAAYYPEYSIAPPSFYYTEENISVHPRRRRHHRHHSRSSSSEDERRISRKPRKSPEPSIPQLTGQLTRACSIAFWRYINQLINYVTSNVFGMEIGKQDLQIALVILLVLVAGLILIGFGGNKTIHLHHWEYFNPPRDL